MPPTVVSIHERIISAAAPLFVQRGIRQISEEEVQRAAGITSREFDLEFSSRDAVAIEILERREHNWSPDALDVLGEPLVGTTPIGRLLAIFDVFDEWFHRDDYEALSRLNEFFEMGHDHPLGHANAGYLLNMRVLAATLAAEAHLSDPVEFALSWHILVTGAVTNAIEGDDLAAARAKTMARDLISRHLPEPLRPVIRPSAVLAGPVDFDQFDLNFDLEFDDVRVASGSHGGETSGAGVASDAGASTEAGAVSYAGRSSGVSPGLGIAFDEYVEFDMDYDIDLAAG